MPALGQTADLTRSGDYSYWRQIDAYRPIANTSYSIGALVQLVSQDQQVAPDGRTVGLPATGAAQQLLLGVVSDAWAGFDGAGATLSPSVNARGTQAIDVVLQGYHPAGLVDQAGTGAATITNGVPLTNSRRTAGYMQGVSSPVAGSGTIGNAVLPASGLCSSLTAATLAQGSNTVTVGGTPATGDVLNVTVQIPYNTTAPGTAQTRTVTTTLTAGQAASTTTAATALAAALNADAVFATYYVATSSVAVVTITVVATAPPFLVTFSTTWAGQTVLAGMFTFSFSGSAANGATLASSVGAGAGSTLTTAGNIAGGAGYFGAIPMLVI